MQEKNPSCPCLLCFVRSLKITSCKVLRKLMKKNALERTYKEPLQNCPFHKTWTYIKAHPEICCCLKHECNNDQFCSCMRCNILTRIRIICYPDHYKRDTPCTGELCGRWLPVSTPCVHTSCMSTVVEHAQIPNANI